MVNFRTEVEGLPEARRAIQELRQSVGAGIGETRGKRAIRAALLAAAEPVVEEAKRRAPFDPSEDSVRGRSWNRGRHLRDEIQAKATVRDSRASSQASVSIGFSEETFYGRFIELGTRYIAPRPFLRPALVSKAGEAVDRFGERMRDEVNRAVQRAARAALRGGRRG